MIFFIFLQNLNFINSSRLIINEEFNIFNCIFYNLGTNINDGGAIYKNNENNIQIILSSFILCTAQYSSGAIYFIVKISCAVFFGDS